MPLCLCPSLPSEIALRKSPFLSQDHCTGGGQRAREKPRAPLAPEPPVRKDQRRKGWGGCCSPLQGSELCPATLLFAENPGPVRSSSSPFVPLENWPRVLPLTFRSTMGPEPKQHSAEQWACPAAGCQAAPLPSLLSGSLRPLGPA